MIYLLGGAGYIGSHLLTQFPTKSIIVVDKDLSTVEGYPCEQVRMDLAEEIPAFKDGDIIYHLATKKHKPSELDPESAYRDIYQVTERMVKASRNKNGFFVFLSTRSLW